MFYNFADWVSPFEMEYLPDSCIDMVLCGLPPYGTTQNKWDSVIPLEKLWEQYDRIVKKMEQSY